MTNFNKMPTFIKSLENTEEPVNFKSYQKQAAETATYPNEQAIPYLALGLVNEAGEVAGLVKKIIRDHGSDFQSSTEVIKLELGDVLWYLAQLANELGIELADIAQLNLDKLQSRKQRGVIGGSGDYR